MSAEAEALGIADQPGLVSAGAVVLPLALGERRLGALGILLSPQDLAKLGRREMELLDALSSQISIAVENARLYSESQRAGELNAALADIDAVLGATFDSGRSGGRGGRAGGPRARAAVSRSSAERSAGTGCCGRCTIRASTVRRRLRSSWSSPPNPRSSS